MRIIADYPKVWPFPTKSLATYSNITKQACSFDPNQVLGIMRAKSLLLLVGTVSLGRRASRRPCSVRDRSPVREAPILLVAPLPELVLIAALSVVADIP